MSLNQILANGGVNPLISEIPEGKLPSLHADFFASTNHIEGARVTFIEQLRLSSKPNMATDTDSQNTLFKQFVGSQESMPRNFKQIISDAHKNCAKTEFSVENLSKN